MLAVRFYDVVVSLHVMAIVLAFGVTFAYPFLVPYITINHPRAVPALYEAVTLTGRRLITPFATIALLLGIYLASDADVWDQTWVTVPLVILIVVLGMQGALFTPTERRLAELTRRDVESAGPAGDVVWSEETKAAARRWNTAGTVASLLVLVAIYFMVAKPFAG
jgi:uncharacterized membrane protein